MNADTAPTADPPAKAKPRLRWYQYSLRTLLFVVFLASLGMSWVGVRLERARKQRVAVEAFNKVGGYVRYDYEEQALSADCPGPLWLRRVVGDDFFRTVRQLHLDVTDVTDAALEQIKGLPELETLNLNSTKVSDAGLEHLEGLTQLQALSLDDTQVTDAGLEHIKGLTQLQELSLNGTEVTDLGLKHLTTLTQLGELYLFNTKVCTF